MPIKRSLILGSLLLGFVLTQAQADEAALYGPTAPPGSAFIRGYNAGSESLDLSVGSVVLNDIAPKNSSDFSFLPAGSYSVAAGAQSLPVKLQQNQYYTLVKLPGGTLSLVDEPVFKNRQKALVRLQNLSDSPLTLRTADGKTEVIKAVSGKSSGEREINPVKVRLALFSGERKISDLSPLVLERGEVACLYVTGSADKLSPVWVKRPVAAN
ncbi:alginate O-acetyltransferase AlgF [Aquipseudomonas ullengensis]|uniref:Alginate biosynthesis protein AlgF n=1 Tax=Aquipseudomonas ullengensis TaxID=2759166 RepID=A0A7W4LN75_9GAMM|nr:alginate O-acetyltransferase AlgF [Pseudomonas ullengensis]MBB2496147.1 alginate O-acetyltransferase AlgF [Pseudomonas ullengensis]